MDSKESLNQLCETIASVTLMVTEERRALKEAVKRVHSDFDGNKDLLDLLETVSTTTILLIPTIIFHNGGKLPLEKSLLDRVENLDGSYVRISRRLGWVDKYDPFFEYNLLEVKMAE